MTAPDIVVRLSPKLVMFAGEPAVWCPGCREMHRINVNKPNEFTGAQWTWDGNATAPTFSPSVHIAPGTDLACHSYIQQGRIEFMPDSGHALRGQHVDLPDFPGGHADD